MNKFFKHSVAPRPLQAISAAVLSFSLCIGIACGTKQVTQASTNVDQEKLEQIKKLIAEQAQQSGSTSTTTGSTNPEALDPKAFVSLSIRPVRFEITEGLVDETLRVIGTQRNGEERTISKDTDFTIAETGVIEIFDDPDSARFDIKALKPGKTNVTAHYQNLNTDFTVEVKVKQITSIEVVPKAISLGVPTRFRLSANYDNLTQTDVTDSIQWQSNGSSLLLGAADSGSSGIFTGQMVGSIGLKAQYQGLSIVSRTQIQMPAIRSIAVSADSSTFLLGTFAPVKAIATFMNGNTFDISSSVHWSVSDSAVGTVNSQGMLDALYPGELVVRAQYGDVYGEETFTVSSVAFRSFRIEPTTASFPLGMNQTFKLYGVLPSNQEQDITPYARWTSSNDLIAKAGGIEEPAVRGLFAAVQKGSAIASVRYGTTTLQAPITITDAALSSMTIKTDNPEGACGVNNPQFMADGILSDNSNKDMTSLVTWSVDPADVAVPSSVSQQNGLILSKKTGIATVTASYLEPSTNQIIRATAPINVQGATVTGVGISSVKNSLAIGQSVQMQAGQIMSCGTGADYTNQVTWSSDNSAIVTISNAAASKGLLTTQGSVSQPTNVTISAIGGGFNGTFNIEIRPKEVTTISLVPIKNSLVVGGDTTTSTLTATYTDSSTADMTNIAAFPGYSLQFSLADCPSTGCGSIHATSGLVTSGSIEGMVRPKVVMTAPDGNLIVSNTASVKVVSKCTGSGKLSGYYCIFLGSKGSSCDTVCQAGSRTYHPATLGTYGSNGDPIECGNALYDLGYIRKLESDRFNHSKGVGCAVWHVPDLGIQQSVRETATTTTAAESDADFQRVCACREP